MDFLNLIQLGFLLLFPILILMNIFKLIYGFLHYETKYSIDKFFSDLRWPFRNFCDQTEKFFFWGWTMRKNYDWDYIGLYQVLEVKLKRMKVCIKKGYSVDSHKKKILKPLDECLRILGRLIADNYDENSNKVTEKWGKLTLTFNEKEDNPRLHSGYFYHENALNPKDQKVADKELYKAMDKDWKQEEKDRIKLFNLIGTHIEYWWD